MKPLTPTTPHLIIMVGIPGAGKTFFAENFAKTFQAPVISFNEIAQAGEFDHDTTAVVAGVMLDQLVKTKRTIIYDGPSDTKTIRQDITKHIASAGYDSLIVWVQTEPNEAKRRALKKQADGTQLSSSEFNEIMQDFVGPDASEKPVVISGKHNYPSQLKIVLRRLAGTLPPPTRSTPNPDTPPDLPRGRASRNIMVR